MHDNMLQRTAHALLTNSEIEIIICSMTERNEDKGKTGQIIINNPHDKVVQKFLQEKETVQSFFNEYLPKEIKEPLTY